MQVVAGVLVILAGAAVGSAGASGWRGALRRNRFVGVRTPAAMSSDRAFLAANRVAGPGLVAAGLVGVAGGSAALAAPSGVAAAVVLVVAAAGVLALSLAAGALGSRAATAAATGRPSPCAVCICGSPGPSPPCLRSSQVGTGS